MWNATSLVQDLNSCRRVHFQQRNHYTTGTFQNYSLTDHVYIHLTVCKKKIINSK